VVAGSHDISGDQWVGLVVPPALVLFGIVLPKDGRLLGKATDDSFLEHVPKTVAAQIEEAEGPSHF